MKRKIIICQRSVQTSQFYVDFACCLSIDNGVYSFSSPRNSHCGRNKEAKKERSEQSWCHKKLRQAANEIFSDWLVKEGVPTEKWEALSLVP